MDYFTKIKNYITVFSLVYIQMCNLNSEILTAGSCDQILKDTFLH